MIPHKNARIPRKKSTHVSQAGAIVVLNVNRKTGIKNNAPRQTWIKSEFLSILLFKINAINIAEIGPRNIATITMNPL